MWESPKLSLGQLNLAVFDQYVAKNIRKKARRKDRKTETQKHRNTETQKVRQPESEIEKLLSQKQLEYSVHAPPPARRD